MDFRGFDSSIILILRAGIFTPIGNFLECLSQAIVVGIILAGRWGVSTHASARIYVQSGRAARDSTARRIQGVIRASAPLARHRRSRGNNNAALRPSFAECVMSSVTPKNISSSVTCAEYGARATKLYAPTFSSKGHGQKIPIGPDLTHASAGESMYLSDSLWIHLRKNVM